MAYTDQGLASCTARRCHNKDKDTQNGDDNKPTWSQTAITCSSIKMSMHTYKFHTWDTNIYC